MASNAEIEAAQESIRDLIDGDHRLRHLPDCDRILIAKAALEAAERVRGAGPTIADEMIERAARALNDARYRADYPAELRKEWHNDRAGREYAYRLARAALEAALKGEG